MNKIGFFIFFAIFVSINFYIFLRGRQALPKDIIIQFIYTAIFWIFALSIFVAFTLEGKISPILIAIAENTGSFWMITFMYFLLMIILGDVLRLTNHVFGIFPAWIRDNYAQVKIIYFTSVVMILFIVSVIGYIRFSNPKTVSLNIDIAGNGSESKAMTIVAVSDVHLGDVIRKRRLIQYVDLINRQNPDLILIAGDLFDRNLHTVERQDMETELRKLKSKYGVYAILGNHEYFGNVKKAMEIISRSGIKLLKDSAVVINNSLVLIGRDDKTNHQRKSLKSLVSNINMDLPTLLLDHQPYNLAEAVENNISFQFSGHTHNGQIFPVNRIVAKMYELAYGYRKKGNTHFYVSSGLGLWGAPIRLGTQSEIVKINLNFVGRKAVASTK